MWYSASLLLISEHLDGPASEPVWEEQIILIEADDETSANAIAVKRGKNEEHEYTNVDGHRIRWVFKHVHSVQPIESSELKDGVELFSRFLRDSEVKSLLTPFD